jgi:16S rRNA (cytidine1402-2'-O)-methyltransferase
VFFEAPHRTAATLAALAEAFGAERPAAVCRELTKTHEEVRRGRLADLVDWASAGVRGEVTLVVGGAAAVPAPRADELVAAVAAAQATGSSRRDAIAEVARRTGVRRNDVYAAVHG